MPALTIATEDPSSNPHPHPPNPSSSPPRPPMSPITPSHSPSHHPGQPIPLPPPGLDLNDAGGSNSRNVPPRLSHSTHPDQVPTTPAPPPQPLDFEDNVDVIALKSVISTLQMQSRRAEEDIRTLRDVKAEALQRPEDFARHIAGMAQHSRSSTAAANEDDSDWPELPGRIPVARCPPINWSQYAVNGQALDALHSEQLARPTQGAPATFSDGVYTHNTGNGRPEEYIGPTAPYDPQKDKLGKKSKGKK